MLAAIRELFGNVARRSETTPETNQNLEKYYVENVDRPSPSEHGEQIRNIFPIFSGQAENYKSVFVSYVQHVEQSLKNSCQIDLLQMFHAIFADYTRTRFNRILKLHSLRKEELAHSELKLAKDVLMVLNGQQSTVNVKQLIENAKNVEHANHQYYIAAAKAGDDMLHWRVSNGIQDDIYQDIYECHMWTFMWSLELQRCWALNPNNSPNNLPIADVISLLAVLMPRPSRPSRFNTKNEHEVYSMLKSFRNVVNKEGSCAFDNTTLKAARDAVPGLFVNMDGIFKHEQGTPHWAMPILYQYGNQERRDGYSTFAKQNIGAAQEEVKFLLEVLMDEPLTRERHHFNGTEQLFLPAPTPGRPPSPRGDGDFDERKNQEQDWNEEAALPQGILDSAHDAFGGLKLGDLFALEDRANQARHKNSAMHGAMRHTRRDRANQARHKNSAMHGAERHTRRDRSKDQNPYRH